MRRTRTPAPEATHHPCGWRDPRRPDEFMPCSTRRTTGCKYGAVWRVITHRRHHKRPHQEDTYYCTPHLPKERQP